MAEINASCDVATIIMDTESKMLIPVNDNDDGLRAPICRLLLWF
jgi:hypothetical protein